MRRGLLALAIGLGLSVGAPAAALTPISGWLSFGNEPTRAGYVATPAAADPAALTLLWTSQVDGVVTSQPLVLRDFPTPGETRIVVGTSKGKLYEINQNGFAVGLKQLGATTFSTCHYLPGNTMGITGTPALDPATGTLYVGDGAGFVHALDAATLVERPGWPVRLFPNPRLQHLWGAINLVKGKLYVASAILCQASETHVFSVDLKSRAVVSWTPVPRALGGGGGMWGWGGVAYDPPTNSLLVATGDALPGGKNTGKAFTESAGYGEHMVQLDLGLRVKASQSPLNYRRVRDSDFSGTPTIFRPSGCPPLVAAENKNGTLYAWRLNRIGAGLYARVNLEQRLNGEAAWSPLTRSLYVVGEENAYRIAVTPSCGLKVAWTIPIPQPSVNGPPIVTQNVVWFAVSNDQSVWAVDTATGSVLTKLSAGEPVYAPIVPLDGRVYVAGFLGLIHAYG